MSSRGSSASARTRGKRRWPIHPCVFSRSSCESRRASSSRIMRCRAASSALSSPALLTREPRESMPVMASVIQKDVFEREVVAFAPGDTFVTELVGACHRLNWNDVSVRVCVVHSSRPRHVVGIGDALHNFGFFAPGFCERRGSVNSSACRNAGAALFPLVLQHSRAVFRIG